MTTGYPSRILTSRSFQRGSPRDRACSAWSAQCWSGPQASIPMRSRSTFPSKTHLSSTAQRQARVRVIGQGFSPGTQSKRSNFILTEATNLAAFPLRVSRNDQISVGILLDISPSMKDADVANERMLRMELVSPANLCKSSLRSMPFSGKTTSLE